MPDRLMAWRAAHVRARVAALAVSKEEMQLAGTSIARVRVCVVCVLCGTVVGMQCIYSGGGFAAVSQIHASRFTMFRECFAVFRGFAEVKHVSRIRGGFAADSRLFRGFTKADSRVSRLFRGSFAL